MESPHVHIRGGQPNISGTSIHIMQTNQPRTRKTLLITEGLEHGPIGGTGENSQGLDVVQTIVGLGMAQKGEESGIQRDRGSGSAMVMELEQHEVQAHQWNYIVEPPDSPATSGEGPVLPTGLSPLIQKITLQRKYDEESDLEEDEGGAKNAKKNKCGQESRGGKERRAERPGHKRETLRKHGPPKDHHTSK